MIKSNKPSPSLLTRSFEELRRTSQSPDNSGRNNFNMGSSSAPTRAARTIYETLREQSPGTSVNTFDPKSLLLRYQAASALRELASLLVENERIFVEGQPELSAAQLRALAHQMSPQLNDSQMIHGQTGTLNNTTVNQAHQISQLLSTYREKMWAIKSLENSRAH